MSLNEITPEELVEFKGNKRGIILNVKKVVSFDEIRNGIINRLGTSVGFFNGAKICAINCDYLSDIQMLELKNDITSRFDIEFVEEEQEQKQSNFQTKHVNNLRSGENIDFDGDVVVMKDMKPGSQINSKGNVVVMGDINSGARVVAEGNVVVMGSVTGFIHAGAQGNENAYVVANRLDPKILQIANIIAEAPDDEYIKEKEVSPEIAFVNQGRIVIEGYLSKVLKRVNP
ncbi:MAG: septum site-determining protein MinC [Peptostreptococcaceae bacterium]